MGLREERLLEDEGEVEDFTFVEEEDTEYTDDWQEA